VKDADDQVTISVERAGHVVVVRLARPPVNAVSRQLMAELDACFAELGADRTVATVVLGAEGDRAFCAGIDLKELSVGAPALGPAQTIGETLDSGLPWRTVQHRIRYLPVPVIAAVDGPAIGAGFGLVGVADLIVASERASFGLTEINVGLLGGASKAIRMLGPHKARMLLFGGELIGAREMYRLGAVEEVVAPGRAIERAVEIGQVFAKKSPIALRLAKESVLRIEGHWLEDAYRTEQDYTTRLSQYNDASEARKAYLDGREPSWGFS
jgi:enoyl-CoA hydratase